MYNQKIITGDPLASIGIQFCQECNNMLYPKVINLFRSFFGISKIRKIKSTKYSYTNVAIANFEQRPIIHAFMVSRFFSYFCVTFFFED